MRNGKEAGFWKCFYIAIESARVVPDAPEND